ASGIAVVVGSMIGSGIFRSPADIAAKLPGPFPMLLVWVVGGLFAICGALTLSEVGGAFPYSGGLYVYIREAYGHLPAFLFGWSNLLLQPASNGAVALVFSQYALRLAGLHPGQPGFDKWSAVLAVVALIAVTVANVLGVKLGAVIQNMTTLAKTGGLAAMIILALAIGLPHAGSHFEPMIPAGSLTFSMFGLALVSVLFACDGWMNVCYISGEVVNPRRNVPRAIVLGVGIVVTVYFLTNLAYLSVFSVTEIARSPTIAADTMSKLIGAGGVTFIVATVMMSTFGALNAGVLTSPRVYFAMSEDKLFFEPLARVHPKFATPHVAVTICGIQGIIYVLIATQLSGSKAFGALIDACVIGNLPFYAMAVGSIFIFRKREKKRVLNSPVKTPEIDDSLLDPVSLGHLETHPHPYLPPVKAMLFPLTPILFIGSVLLLISNSLLDSAARGPSLVVLGALAAGAPLYYATIGRNNKAANNTK
ncbi:MAG: amino acid permease, partial [Chthonomonadales bacterium]